MKPQTGGKLSQRQPLTEHTNLKKNTHNYFLYFLSFDLIIQNFLSAYLFNSKYSFWCPRRQQHSSPLQLRPCCGPPLRHADTKKGSLFWINIVQQRSSST